MSKFKATPHGSLWVSSTNEFTESLYTLKVFCRSAAASSSLKYDAKTTLMMMDLCREMTGRSFKDFLAENFNNGMARRAPLVTEIVNYLNGTVTWRAVKTQITIGENALRQKVAKDLNFAHTVAERQSSTLPKGFEKITNKDFFRLIECLGPVHVARLFLMLAGESFYATRQ